MERRALNDIGEIPGSGNYYLFIYIYIYILLFVFLPHATMIICRPLILTSASYLLCVFIVCFLLYCRDYHFT